MKNYFIKILDRIVNPAPTFPAPKRFPAVSFTVRVGDLVEEEVNYEEALLKGATYIVDTLRALGTKQKQLKWLMGVHPEVSYVREDLKCNYPSIKMENE